MADAGPYRVARHETLGSTNDEAMALLRAGDLGDVFVVAARQTGGRGRQGRVWASPPGNLYASVALRDPSALRVAPQLGFVAGVALCEALRSFLRGDARLAIKWPNDMLFGGAKLAGLLLESASLPDGALGCVIGFGVNCASHPNGLAYPATDLATAAGHAAGPDAVLEALGPALAAELALWDKGAGFAAIRARWLARAAGLGEPITVVTPTKTHAGLLSGLADDGRLALQTDAGLVRIDAGDVFLPGVATGAMNHSTTKR